MDALRNSVLAINPFETSWHWYRCHLGGYSSALLAAQANDRCFQFVVDDRLRSVKFPLTQAARKHGCSAMQGWVASIARNGKLFEQPEEAQHAAGVEID